MQINGNNRGFSLLEMMIVLAIIGIVTAMAVPNLMRWQLREDARSHAGSIASVLARARDTAKTRGISTFVLFGGGGGVFALMVEDNDGDFLIGPTDNQIPYQRQPEVSTYVDGYGAGAEATDIFADVALAPEDAAVGLLDNLVGGTTFPVAAAFGTPAVGFTSQGIPVDLNTPGQWGSGAGAYYVTDNATSVYAVVLLPLGGIRVRSLSPATNQWR